MEVHKITPSARPGDLFPKEYTPEFADAGAQEQAVRDNELIKRHLIEIGQCTKAMAENALRNTVGECDPKTLLAHFNDAHQNQLFIDQKLRDIASMKSGLITADDITGKIQPDIDLAS